jgi:hypothetical protein
MLFSYFSQEKNNEDPPLTSRMEIAKSQMQDIFQALSLLQEQEGVAIDPDSKPSLNFGLVAVCTHIHAIQYWFYALRVVMFIALLMLCRAT